MKPLRLEMSPTQNRRINEMLGLLMLTVGVLLLLCLVSYTPSDPSWNTVGAYASGRPAHNWTGLMGAWTSDLLLQLVGIACFALPFVFLRLGMYWLRSRHAGSAWSKSIGLLLWIVFTPSALALMPGHLLWRHVLPIEGVVGRLTADELMRLLNFPGTCIVLVVTISLSIYLSTTFSFNTWRDWLETRFTFVQRWKERRMQRRIEKAAAAAERDEESFHSEREKVVEEQLAAEQQAAPRENNSLISSLWARFSMWRRGVRPDKSGADEEVSPANASMWTRMPRTLVDAEAQPEPEFHPVPADLAEVADAMLQREVTGQQEEFDDWTTSHAASAPVVPQEAAFDWIDNNEPIDPPINQITRPILTQPISSASLPVPAASTLPPATAAPTEDAISFSKRADESLKSVTLVAKSVRGYKLPPSDLLQHNEDHSAVREEELRDEARILVEKCAEFGVAGQVTQINPGPVVTTFEFRPDAGVKYSRVTGLADDLCLAMAAESILIERMAGKSTVGIQVPNTERETISLRDVVESENFVHSKSRLAIAMGKDINGRIVTADLASMPHVLIAGSTGSGKSVAINSMIMSVLFKSTPEQVRMILVDPKRVELGMYEGIPHLFTPIITEPKLAANALRNAVREMERRLKLLASRHVRNLDQYNKLFERGQLFNEDGEEQEPLPYIMIIIDELADLMMLDKANVEESITRLAQMARAVGIHLVLATQRPSVDVITGLIKANVPTRMSFRLATRVDSRTIIDSNGAESLLGRGDMLFLPPGTSRLQRVHAPYVTEDEISSVVDFWKAQGEAEYVQGFLEGPKDEKVRGDGEGGASEEEDELFNDAVRLVFEFGKASTSLLQRRLRIGYGRAAHLIDMMEADGLVGPAEGSKPREILKSPDWLREVDEAMH